jgi:carbon-monoxide dehydrogenase medium subunit
MSEVFRPTTLRETVNLLYKLGPQCKIIAGGTDIMVDLKSKGLPCTHLISLDRVQDRILKSITFKGRRLTIGSAVQIRAIESSSTIVKRAPILADVARTFATTQVRNVATVGGNLCRASPAADFGPALLALDAKVNVKSNQGERVIPMRHFFLGAGQSVLKPRELVVTITADLPRKHGGAFLKYTGRSPHDLAAASAAAVIERDRSRKNVQNAIIALGAVAPTPIIANKTSRMLEGKPLNDDICTKASESAVKESSPITDGRASLEYRRKMTALLVRRVLHAAWERS